MSSVSSLQDLLHRAQRLVQVGNLSGARDLVKQAYALDNTNPDVLVLVAQLTDDPQRKRTALLKALQTDPFHREAQSFLDALDGPAASSVIVEEIVARPRRPKFTLRRLLYSVVGCALIAWCGIGLLVTALSKVFVASIPTLLPTGMIQSSANSAPAFANVTTLPTLVVTNQDPIAATATALQMQQTVTSLSLQKTATQASQNTGSTQTATLQGALAVTVAAQQTAISALNTLPGTLVMFFTNQYNVTNPKMRFMDPADKSILMISPDGKHMVYLDTHQGGHISDLDGTQDQPLANLNLNDSNNSRWSPDSQHIAFFGEGQKLMVTGLDGNLKPLMPEGLTVSQVQWSPDSQQLVFVGQGSQGMAIYLADFGGPTGNAHPITAFATGSPTTPFLSYDAPQWLPDSQRLVFDGIVSSATKTPGSSSRVIGTIHRDGTQSSILRTITSKELVNPAGLSLSPNGKFAYFYADDHTTRNLYLLSIDSGTFKKALEVGYATAGGSAPKWSPDGVYLAGYQRFQNPLWQVYWIRADSAELHIATLDTSYNYGLALWSPDSHAILTCYSVNDNTGVKSGAMMLIPIVDNAAPIALLNQPICPNLWLP